MPDPRASLHIPTHPAMPLRDAIEYGARALTIEVNRRIVSGRVSVEHKDTGAVLWVPMGAHFPQTIRVEVRGATANATIEQEIRGSLFSGRSRRRRLGVFMHHLELALRGEAPVLEEPNLNPLPSMGIAWLALVVSLLFFGLIVATTFSRPDFRSFAALLLFGSVLYYALRYFNHVRDRHRERGPRD